MEVFKKYFRWLVKFSLWLKFDSEIIISSIFLNKHGIEHVTNLLTYNCKYWYDKEYYHLLEMLDGLTASFISYTILP